MRERLQLVPRRTVVNQKAGCEGGMGAVPPRLNKEMLISPPKIKRSDAEMDERRTRKSGLLCRAWEKSR
jgi:hypothetical protein